jgi:hypothetical protein
MNCLYICFTILHEKSERCGFVQWIDEEWPRRAREVILTLWDMVAQFMETSDLNMVDGNEE